MISIVANFSEKLQSCSSFFICLHGQPRLFVDRYAHRAGGTGRTKLIVQLKEYFLHSVFYELVGYQGIVFLLRSILTIVLVIKNCNLSIIK